MSKINNSSTENVMPELIHIGERLKTLLNQKRISQAELARRLGTTAQSVNNSLNNQSMNTDTLQQMLIHMGSDLVEFATLEEAADIKSELDEIKDRLSELERKIS
ncbi:MAG: helix-turn-helix transcriptional regulator [Bacteroidota bacterium]